MKKVYIFFFILFLSSFINNQLEAKSYYEELIDYKGTFLKDFTDDDYDSYYSKISKRKFSGWRIYYVNKEEDITYKKETIFSYYNDGYTAIDYDYKSETKKETKLSYEVSGDIKLKTKNKTTKLEKSLENSISFDFSSESSEEAKETIELSIKIDPQTKVNLYIIGEGTVTNGVAIKYLFFFKNKKGGFEIFEPISEYARLEKIRI